jgi:precorrin-6B methylase 2
MLTKAVSLGGESVGIRYAPGDFSDLALWPSMGEYPIYDTFLYDEMTADEVRNREYQRVIEACVRDKIVLEIGTGRDLLWATACARSGARKVYAVEVIEEAYRHASLLVRRLGLEDTVVLVHGNSMNVTLPEKAEVCVSEIIGNIGSSEGAECVIQDAKDRLLTKGAILIPQRCVTEMAALSLPEAFLSAPHFAGSGTLC